MKKLSGVFMILFLMLAPLAVNAEEEWSEDGVVKWVEPGDQIAEFFSLLGTGSSYTTNRIKAEIRYLAYDGSKAVLAVTVKVSFQIFSVSVKDLPVAGYTVDLRLEPGRNVIIGDPTMTNIPYKIEFLGGENPERGSIEIKVAPAS